MHQRDIRALIALNNRFYRDHAASFSATRSTPWQGWRRVADIVRQRLTAQASPAEEVLRVADIACGNMRFSRFLEEELPGRRIAYYGIDACADLARQYTDAGFPASGENGLPSCAMATDDRARPTALVDRNFQYLDILEEALAHGTGALDRCALAPCDLVCCFGFMHHVPDQLLRRDIVHSLVDACRPHGVVAISLWQFMNDERLAAKARAVTACAQNAGFAPPLEDSDYLLGWQDDAQALRYCHHFPEREIDELACAVAPIAREICRFSADGRSGCLNRYLVMERI